MASALQRFLTKTGVDKTYGIYDKGGKFFIGTKEVKIKGDDIIIDNSVYRGTPGLWELIVSKDPNRDLYTTIDFENYKRILIETDAKRSPKNPNKPKSNKGAKWTLLRDNVWKGLKKGRGVIVIPSHPNVWLERLDLLLASQTAGHTGVGNELTSICDELKRQGVIDTNTYKKINSHIKI